MSDLRNIYVWDTETCIDRVEYEKVKNIINNTDGKTLKQKLVPHRVWASGIYSVEDDSEVAIDMSIEGAFQSMVNIASKAPKNKKAIFYAHNASYDCSYMKDYLLKQGFKQYEPLYYNDEEISDQPPKSILAVETVEHIFYKLVIATKSGLVFEIRDSLKKIPLSVDSIAKAFNLDTLKGAIDYDMIREYDHVLTDNEREYLKNDCVIMTQALRYFYNQGFSELTISSSALNNWKETLFTKEQYDNWCKKKKESGAKIKGLGSKNLHKKAIEKQYRQLMPEIDKEIDDFIRRSYKGGITYVNPKVKGKNIRLRGRVHDVNSLYPSRMHNTLLPWGTPVEFGGKYKQDKNYPLYVQQIYITHAQLKDSNSFPFIQIKDKSYPHNFGRGYKSTEYLSVIEDAQLVLTNVELEDFLKHYEVSGLQYLGGYKFRGKKTIFNNYIEKWIEVKKNSKGGMRQIAKLMLNSLYGKFATNCKRETLRNYVNEYGYVVTNEVIEEHNSKFEYTAISSFITAYSRRTLINAVYSIPFDNFYYCDTDSIHFNDKNPDGSDVKIDNNLFPIDFDNSGDLGLWKLEGVFTDAKYIGAKKYMELIEGEWDVKCCGLPSEVRATIKGKDMFEYGVEFDNKLRKLTGVGGVRLIKTKYKLNDTSLLF